MEPHAVSQGRQYKSRKTRPCDFCRKRKSCCIIESVPPCSLCRRFGKSCTFVEKASKNRQKNARRLYAMDPKGLDIDRINDLKDPVNESQNGLELINKSNQEGQTSPELAENLVLMPMDSEALSSGTSSFDQHDRQTSMPPFSDLELSSPGASLEEASKQLFDFLLEGSLLRDTNNDSNSQNEGNRNDAAMNHHQLPLSVPDDKQSLDPAWGMERNCRTQWMGRSSFLDPFLLSLFPTGDHREVQIGPALMRKLDTRGHSVFLHKVLVEEGSMMSPLSGFCSNTLDADMSQQKSRREEVYKIVGKYGPHLMVLFFRNVNPFFPIFSRSRFYYANHQNVYLFDLSLLSTILGIACDWWSFDLELSLHRPPSSSRLFEIAWSEICREMHEPKYYCVQASLLLSQRKPVNPTAFDSPFIWSLLGSTVSLGHTLGLNLDCDNWQVPQWEKRIRKRLWWAIFIQEKWFSVSYGRPSHIHKDSWNVSVVTEHDYTSFPDPTVNSDEYGPKNFSSMATLTLIVNEIVCKFCPIPGKKRLPANDLVQLAKPLQLKLNEWFRNLSECLSIDSSDNYQLNANGSLHLAFLTAKILLYRSLIESACDDNVDEEARAPIREGAVKCAESLVRFVDSLKPVHFQSFWYSWSRLNFATASNYFILLLATCRSQEEFSCIKRLIDKYRWLLCTKAAVFDVMKLGLMLLDTYYTSVLHKLEFNCDIGKVVGSTMSSIDESQTSNFAFGQANQNNGDVHV